MNDISDVIVVGGGASGMMSAGLLAKEGKSVLLIEKNSKLGEKLSRTGGGRCNITNAEFDTKKLLENYGEAKKFLYSPFSKFSVQDTFDFFEKIGIEIVVEARKRAFPKTQKAEDVTQALLQFVASNSVQVLLNSKVKRIDRNKHTELFEVFVSGRDKPFLSKTVIFAVGGPSGKTMSKEIPQSWKILKDMGHTVNAPSPSLVPLETRAKFVHRLSGLTMSFVAMRFKVENKTQFRVVGKVLFTHFGVSGPTVLNTSARALEILRETGRLTLSIDFFPDTEFDKLDRRLLSAISKHPNRKVRNILADLVPEELAKTVLYITDKNLMEVVANDLRKEERRAIVHKLKDFHFNIVGSMGLDWAIVADGGVSLEEVDFKTMESKVVPNLFLTGDVLNIQRPSGGYSLQLCWTTAHVAKEGILRKIESL